MLFLTDGNRSGEPAMNNNSENEIEKTRAIHLYTLTLTVMQFLFRHAYSEMND